MARVAAETLKTSKGRRVQNGNAAQRVQGRKPIESADDETPAVEEPDEAASVEETEDELEEAKTDETPMPPPREGRSTQRRVKAVDVDPDIVALGKLTRFALEEKLPIEDVVEGMRAMVNAYDRATSEA